MKRLFTKILVPVNFNRNTKMAIQKAIQVANEFHCDIHLLHVQALSGIIPFFYDGHFTGSLSNYSTDSSTKKLEKLKTIHSRSLHLGLQLSSSVEIGDWQSMMKKTIITEHIDLVLIPNRRKKFWGALIQKININKLVQQTQCPVLTVTREFNVHQLHKILVPVGDVLPIKKLTMATFLARQNDGHVYLMSTTSNNRKTEKRGKWCITKAYQLLRDHTRVNIHCTLQPEQQGFSGTLHLANEVKADLIVVNSGKESQPAGWLSKIMGKYICRESNIPVLTVGPVNSFN